MNRLILGIFVGAALAACGHADRAVVRQPDAGRGPLDPRARSLPATRTCVGDAPPVPWIRARRTRDRIRIQYRLLARPRACRPSAILVTANSVDKLDNIAPAERAGPVRLTGDEGTVELKLPPLDLPPYEARASTITSRGRRSATTTVPVPERGGYCRRTQGAAICIRRAQAKFVRCLRGAAPRTACPDYVWNARPLIPYVPLEGRVTRAGLERSFAYVAQRAGGDPPFASVSCPSSRVCIAAWRSHDKVFRARYAVSGYGQRPGCWIAERRAVLEETPPRFEHAVPLRHVVAERQSGCVDWAA